MISANYVDGLELRIKEITAERDAALAREAELVAQVELLKGVKPEMPPRPPQGEGLPRYGIKWSGDKQPITTPMNDGYWTPYHLVQQHLLDIQAEAGWVGYYNGFKDALVIEPPLPTSTGTSATIDVFAYRVEQASRYAARQYAERIKRGEL